MASSDFDNDGFILIIFGKQHRHTSKSDAPIQLSSFLHFCLLYLLLNSSDQNDANCNVFIGRLWVALKSASHVGWFALKKRRFRSADVQSDVLLLSRMNITAFSIDQQWSMVFL